MIKYHSLISLAFGVLFFVLFNNQTRETVFRFLLPIFIAYVLALFIYNVWYLKKLEKYNFWVVVRPSLLVLSGVGIYFLIPSAGVRAAFLLVSIIVIGGFEFFLAEYSENILFNETLLVAFGCFFSLFGLYQIFPSYGLVYVVLAFFASFVMARGVYEFIPKPKLLKFFSSFIAALVTAEFLWVLSWLPLHFSVLAVILVSLFYLLVVINYYFYFNILNFQKIQYHLFFSLVLFCVGTSFYTLENFRIN